MALSYLEKAIQVEAKNGGAENVEAPLVGAMPGHVTQAGKLLKSQRRAFNNYLSKRQSGLNKLLAERQSLSERVTKGKVPPEKANELSRALSSQMDLLNKEIDALDTARDAQSAAALGGFIDLQLERYTWNLEGDSRKSVPPARTAFSWRPVLAMALIGFAVFCAVYGIIFTFFTEESVVFSVFSPPSSGDAIITVLCTNKSSASTDFYIPWPEVLDQGTGNERYGVVVHVREKGTKDFRLLPSTEGCWLHNGMPLPHADVFSVIPGMTLQLGLDVEKVKELGVKPEALRVDLTDINGAALRSFDVNLNGN